MGEFHALLVEGVPGIGKSSLVDALIRRPVAEDAYRFWTGPTRWERHPMEDPDRVIDRVCCDTEDRVTIAIPSERSESKDLS